MGTQGEHSVIHRKAQVARDEFDAREMSPAKALRLSLAKAADRLFDLALTVSTVEQILLPQTGIEAEVGNEGLLVLLDGEGGARGALRLDIQFLAALIEVQLMGKVRTGEVAPRPVTRTDAAIAAPLIDALLAGFDRNQQEGMADYVPGGFRFGDLIEDGRTLALALGGPDYDLFRVTADLGPGARSGMLSLILPRRTAPKEREGPERAAGLAVKLEENAMNAPVTLDAVMGRMSLPLNQVCGWRPGTLLPLGPDALTETQLLGAKGHVVARVRLGQLNGFRAVRLILPDAPGQEGGALPPNANPVPDRAPSAQVIDHVPDRAAPASGPAPGAGSAQDMHDQIPQDALSLLPQLIGAATGSSTLPHMAGNQEEAEA